MQRKRRPMVLAPCHAVCVKPALARTDGGWAGGFRNESIKYWEHAEAAARQAGEEPSAVLVPSGGATRVKAGNLAEGESLKNLIEYESYFGHADLRDRTLPEVYARDSFENLLFALCRFRAAEGVYPDAITVMGWAFKQERFELHRQAIWWKREFRYIGVNNPEGGKPLETALAGERPQARSGP